MLRYEMTDESRLVKLWKEVMLRYEMTDESRLVKLWKEVLLRYEVADESRLVKLWRGVAKSGKKVKYECSLESIKYAVLTVLLIPVATVVRRYKGSQPRLWNIQNLGAVPP